MRNLHEAEWLWGKGEANAAEFRMEQAVAEAPHDAAIRARLALLRVSQGRRPAAEATLSEAMGLDPTEPAVWFARAHLRVMDLKVVRLPFFGATLFGPTSRIRDAVRDLREAVRLAPHVNGYRIALSGFLGMWLRTREAVAVAEEAVRQDPESVDALVCLADAFQLAGRGIKAREALEQALRLDPESAEVRSRLGWMRLEEGDDLAAEEHFASALRLEPGSRSALRGLGLCARRRFAPYRWFSLADLSVQALPVVRRYLFLLLLLLLWMGSVGVSDALAQRHPGFRPVPGCLVAVPFVLILLMALFGTLARWKARNRTEPQESEEMQRSRRWRRLAPFLGIAFLGGVLFGALKHLETTWIRGLLGAVPGLAGLCYALMFETTRYRLRARIYAGLLLVVGVFLSFWMESNGVRLAGRDAILALALPLFPLGILLEHDGKLALEERRQSVRRTLK